MSAIFLQGDARVVLQGLPDNFFHCAVTSPPYFGLRKYDGGEEIWDGDSDCEHEWGKRKVTRRGHPGTKSTLVGTQTAELSKAVDTHGSTCLLCGAWKGQLGGEPTPDLYISHLIQ
ncbi:MAG: hypothetical protein KKD44_25750, partial [Proteobacteria bacterium]|nr:hypothetical protein [Pseudomonadota bacterium]